MHFTARLILLLSIGLLCANCSVLHEDDVGVNDWSKENVGGILDAHFFATPSKKSIFVSTEENAIASLNIKSGDIAWRQLALDGEVVVKLIHKGENLFSITRSITAGSVVLTFRYWDGLDGSLVWNDPHVISQHVPYAQLADATFIQDMDGDRIDDVAIVTPSLFEIRSGRDGHVVFSKERTLGEQPFAPVSSTIFAASNEIHTVSPISATAFAWSTFDITTKTLKPIKLVVAPENIQLGSSFVISDTHIFALSKRNQLLYYSLSSQSNKFNVVEINKFSSGYIDSVVLASNGHVAARIKNDEENQILLFRVTTTVELVHEFKRTKVVSFTSEDNYRFFAAATLDLLEVYNVEQNTVHTLKTGIDITQHGGIKKFFLNTFTKKESSVPNFRVLIITQDNAASLLQDDVIVWHREEALGSISKIEFLDLPSSHVFDSFVNTLQREEDDNFILRFVKRLIAQVRQLQDFFQGSSKGHSDGQAQLVKDQFGLRQLLLTMTKSGKLYALHSDDGAIVWTKFFPSPRQCDFYITRTSAFFPPEAMVLCPKSKQTQVYWINPLTGEQLRSESFPFEAFQTIVLPQHDQNGNQFMMVIDTAGNIHPFPQTEETVALFQSHNNTIFYYTTNRGTGDIQGFTVGAMTEPFTFESVRVWSINFPVGTEQIESVAYPNWQEKITTPARILGDRSALRKYINKNMIAVATVKKTTGKPDPTLNIHLIDTVTGSFIHSAYIPKASDPVSLVQSENWVVYHYWSSQNVRFEIGVIELYEKDLDWSGTTYSSFEPRKPVVLEQSYVFPSSVRTLAVTTTLHGLSTKQVLVGLPTGQIMAISKPFLDPRRPSKAEAAKMNPEEGLIPYQPVVPIFAKNFITYYKKVGNLRTIKTHGAILESTTLVAAYGIDLFFARTYPSNTFDILDPDFNYFALIVTTIGVLVATVITSRLSKKADLARMWK